MHVKDDRLRWISMLSGSSVVQGRPDDWLLQCPCERLEEHIWHRQSMPFNRLTVNGRRCGTVVAVIDRGVDVAEVETLSARCVS